MHQTHTRSALSLWCIPLQLQARAVFGAPRAQRPPIQVLCDLLIKQEHGASIVLNHHIVLAMPSGTNPGTSPEHDNASSHVLWTIGEHVGQAIVSRWGDFEHDASFEA